jgi:virginiamycin B lyase
VNPGRHFFTVIAFVAAAGFATAHGSEDEQRWLGRNERGLTTDAALQCLAPLPNKGSAPTTISITRDGTLWFTQSNGNRIGRVNPDGGGLREFALPNAASAPRIIALGADSNLWFSEHGGNRMGRLTPAGKLDEFTIPTPDSGPRAIALGADGNIWFGMFAAGKIGRITPGGVITEFVIPTPDSGPRALAAGPDGNIWFSEYKTSKIGRITPRGEITEFATPRPNSGPGDITAGADGAMWFLELSGGMDGVQTDGNRVGRIDMRGRITEFAMPEGRASAVNLAVGPDRNVWYTRGALLGRVTPEGEITEFPLGEGVRGVGISAGSDRQPPRSLVNRLYFADGAGDRLCYFGFAPARKR